MMMTSNKTLDCLPLFCQLFGLHKDKGTTPAGLADGGVHMLDIARLGSKGQHHDNDDSTEATSSHIQPSIQLCDDSHHGGRSSSSPIPIPSNAATSPTNAADLASPLAQSPCSLSSSTCSGSIVSALKVSQGKRYILGYEILDTLGKGASAKVKRGRCPETGELVALKIIDKAKARPSLLARLHSEVVAMRLLNYHPNIVKLLHYDFSATYPRKYGGTREVVCLVMELAPHGELEELLKRTGPLPEGIAKAFFHQLLYALACCHEHGIYHRDVKPENILLDETFQLKLGDFGLAAIRSDPRQPLNAECGTRLFMAPEVASRRRSYTGATADTWSAGVVLFIMLTGEIPFQRARPGDYFFDLLLSGQTDMFWALHCHYNHHLPRGAQDLLSRIFTVDPTNRPTARDLLHDPWLANDEYMQ